MERRKPPSGWTSLRRRKTVSKDILERALNRTTEIEEKQKKAHQLAKNVGQVLGLTAAVGFDSLIAWLCLRFLMGLTAISFWQVVGAVIIYSLVLSKMRLLLK